MAVANRGSWPNYADGSVSILSGNGNGTFQSAINFNAGPIPRSIAVGDFNGDDKLDLAVANSSKVAVLMGNGDGTFQTASNYVTGSNPQFVVVGDLNGDAKLDLAVANYGYFMNGKLTNSSVSVLLGNGDGTFQSAVSYGAGSAPESLALGDFNGDGKLDLAVANNYSTNVSVLLNKGDGTFRVAVNYNVITPPDAIAVGDFNGDGKLDLVVVNGVGTVAVLLGEGDGTLNAAVSYRAGSSPLSVSVGDFNGDGRLDLAVANADSHDVSVLLGQGDGTFQAAVNYSTGATPFSVAVADFNGDGRPDIAVANYGSDLDGYNDRSVSVMLNTCVSVDVPLSVVRSNSSLTISWPVPPNGFILESTMNLRTPNWQPAAEEVVTNNSRLETTVPLGQAARYFRLHNSE